MLPIFLEHVYSKSHLPLLTKHGGSRRTLTFRQWGTSCAGSLGRCLATAKSWSRAASSPLCVLASCRASLAVGSASAPPPTVRPRCVGFHWRSLWTCSHGMPPVPSPLEYREAISVTERYSHTLRKIWASTYELL